MRKFVYVSEMLIVRHLGTPNSGFNGCHCMRDPVLYRSMHVVLSSVFIKNDLMLPWCFFYRGMMSKQVEVFFWQIANETSVLSMVTHY